jgi:phosphatidylserine decarboxylase
MPRFLLTPFIRIFSRLYGVELTEATQQVSEFRTFNEFFTRQLLPDSRPLDPDPDAVLSPVDGFIGEYGRINDGRLIQAKGLDYRLADLLRDSKRGCLYDSGEFITIYLAPQNYHRIHSMVDGKVHEFSYIPGDLWTVSPLGVHHVTNLFARNERLTTYIQTEKGECALVKVGATVVGRIRISYDNQISNLHGALAKQVLLKKPYELRRGEEVGMFELGSTVICLFPPGQVELNEMELGQKIKMGNNIGRFKLK